jgi:peptidoglycan/LPS O-acetylase OafA/YrhL
MGYLSGIQHLEKASVFTTSCFDAFGIGGLYAYCQLDEHRYAQLKKALRIFIPAALVIYFVWKLCPYFDVVPKFDFFQRTIDGIISIGIIHLVLINKSKWVNNKILENKALNTIGKISYGLYLFHYVYYILFVQFVDFIISKRSSFDWLKNRFVYKPLMLITLFALAYLSFELFEKRVMKLKKKFKYAEGGNGSSEINPPEAG